MLNNLDLNKLKILVSVYDSRSITESSKDLGLTPSAVSQSIRALEKELGTPIFSRVSNRLVPNETSKELVQLMRRFLHDFEVTLKEKKSEAGLLHGHLKIGTPPEFGSNILISAIKEFSQHKHCTFEFVYGLPEDLGKMLCENKLDLAFCDNGPYIPNLEEKLLFKEVFSEELVLVGSNKFFKRNNLNPKPKYLELLEVDHVDYRSDGDSLKIWYQYHYKKNPPRRIKFSANNVRTLIEAVRKDIGLGMIPRYMIEKELNQKKFIEVQTSKKSYSSKILIAQLQDKVPSLLEREFVQFCLQSL